MRALILATLLAASPPPAEQARKLGSRRAWEELYLAYAAAEPEGYPPADRRTIAAALQKGCEALASSDQVMAYSLGERAVSFDETAPGLRCVARTALATQQRGAAEAALRQGLEHFPKDGHFALELGRLLLEEKDPQGAIAALEQVPPRSPQASRARTLLKKARLQASEEHEARSQARRIERRFEGEPRATPSSDSASSGLSYTSGVSADGMRTRANRRFVVKYFNNQRDFGQRAEYEGRVVAALEEAYAHTRTVLGEARESPVDVVLYTREEFRTHHGAGLARAVAGLYSDGAIRINDAAELDSGTKATLVHEYVHAVLDDLRQASPPGQRLPIWLNEGIATYVEWRDLGGDKPPHALAVRLRGAAHSGRLPRLSA
ncbi:MAG TPA: tetratricopeptide repeat protein, partial [Myxococcaceae bacterium]|nr:tetratricopeptide repeat protein [Myxococcaceae bacterium]